MASFKFELVSPERLLFSDNVEQVVIPGAEGEMTVMAMHAPTLSSLKPGVVKVRSASGENAFVVFGGFADITPDGCTLLAESAVKVADLNPGEIARRIAAAQEDLADAKDDAGRTAAQQLVDHLSTLQAAL